MIRRRIFAALLTLGVIFGFGSGIASLAWRHHAACGSSCGSERAEWGSRYTPPARPDPAIAAAADREAFKAEVAAACADAVRRSLPPPPAAQPQMIPMPYAMPYPQYAPPPPPPAAPPNP